MHKHAVNELFKIEYLCYSQELHDESLRSYSTKWFTIPMFNIIPSLENIFNDEDVNFKKKIEGKILKLFGASLKNDKKDYASLYRKILYIPNVEIKHKNIARILNKPPKYLTFFFEYRGYFDNVTGMNQSTFDETFET